jgi:hypothetical protein
VIEQGDFFILKRFSDFDEGVDMMMDALRVRR